MPSNTFNNTNALAETLLTNFVAGFNTAQAGASTVVSYADGTVFPVVPSGYGEAVISTPVTSPVLLPADFPVLYDSAGVATTVIGAGGNNQAVVAESGGLTYDFNGGAGVLYTGISSVPGAVPLGDTIFLDGAGPGYVAAGGGQDTVVASSGDNFIALGGGANTLFLDGGFNLVGSEGNDQIVLGTTGSAALGSSTISLSGSSSVWGGSGSLFLLNGAGNTFLYSQVDPTTGAITSTAADTVFGGTGGGAYYGGSNGGNIMVAGDAATTLVGGGTGDALYAFGPSNDVLEASGTFAFLIGTAGTGNNTYFADSTSAYISGGGGADTFVLGSGNSTMTAGVGADQFDFTNGSGGGFDVIFGFKVGTDQVNLFNYDLDGVSAATNALQQAAANSDGTSTFVTLADNTTIYFLNTPFLSNNSFTG